MSSKLNGPAKMIGRFEIIKELGRGAQGIVYLARDPQLEREVAIKTLRKGSMQQNDKLLHEARIASKLQHTSIIPLHDAGEQDGSPYLVYAYIKGETLAQLIKRTGAMPLANAARISASVLDALACAHGQGVMHLDIKPANVMLGENVQAMVMDFGIARIISQQSDSSGEITGTPQYMAPECISSEGPQFSSDLFSVGMMLYEMVTGTPVVDGGNIYQILNRNAHEKAEAPSSRNVQVDEKLEGIILKAIAKKPEERYPDALAMRQALLQYLDATGGESQSETSGKGGAHSTLDFLLRRMRSKSDFPALSGIISEINKIVSSESESASKLAQTILQDFALTNKLLKLVNTVSYGQFGGNINTISKAVVILGFETVRNIAMSLILLEFLQNKSQALEMKDEVIGSFFAGIIAARLSPGSRAGDAEESMICAMFHNLGRMLAKFYFFEESQEVERLMQDQGLDEERAATKVLGLSYNDLGVGVAKSWNFPSRLLAGMQKLSGDKIKKPSNDTDQLCVTVNMANELCAISAVTDPKDKDKALRKLSVRYAGAAHVSESVFTKALENSLQELSQRSVVLGINTKQSPMLKRVRQWSGHVEPEPKVDLPATDEMSGVTELDTTVPGEIAANGELPPDAEAILSAGIQDVTNTLVEDFQLNDVLRMVLETIYRSLGFQHALMMIRDNKQNQMAARFGFGENVNVLIPRFHFPLVFEPDVFHLAVDKGLDIVIEDVRAENIASKIPQWYHSTVSSQCFLLLPVVVNKKTIGLIYADMQKANSFKMTKQQLTLLKTLRNQAILAIKQKT